MQQCNSHVPQFQLLRQAFAPTHSVPTVVKKVLPALPLLWPAMQQYCCFSQVLCALQLCFQLACTTYTDAWVNLSLFYPLSALPEILAVIILCRHSLLPIITQGRLGTHINSAAGGTDAQTAFTHNHGSNDSHHRRPQQAFSAAFFPGTKSEGYSQQPYQQEPDYPTLPYQHAGYEQGRGEEPYQQQRQGQNVLHGPCFQRPYESQLGMADQRAPLHGQHAQHGQCAQHGRSQHAGTHWQGMPQNAPPQQLSGTLTQDSLPFRHDEALSQVGPLPFPPSGLPSERASAAQHLGPLYPPYYPNHGQQPPSFFHYQHA